MDLLEALQWYLESVRFLHPKTSMFYALFPLTVHQLIMASPR